MGAQSQSARGAGLAVGDTTIISAKKKALREQMLSERLRLTPDQWAHYSQTLSLNLADCLGRLGMPQPGQVVGLCWPFKQEPDVRPQAELWAANQVLLALPVVVQPGEPLLFRRWVPNQAMAEDCYGIPVPATGEWLVPDILLLPGNAFDREGYRLGYGGGFFDRTLAVWPRRPLVLGLTFDEYLVETVYPESHDQVVDWVVTEKRMLKTS